MGEHRSFLLYSCYRFLGQWKVDTCTEEEGSYCWRSSWFSRAAWMVHGQEWVGSQQFPWPLRCAPSFSIPTCGSSLVGCGPLQLPLLERKVCAHTFITLVSGAFVAGLDAGLVYNSFPKFADRWIPEDILAFSPTLRNITENPATVQFNHRILGTSTLAALLLTAARAQFLPLPPHLRLTALALGGMGCLQVAMGITTLLLYVPVPVAAAHQSGALATLSLAMWLAHEMRLAKIVKHIPK